MRKPDREKQHMTSSENQRKQMALRPNCPAGFRNDEARCAQGERGASPLAFRVETGGLLEPEQNNFTGLSVGAWHRY